MKILSTIFLIALSLNLLSCGKSTQLLGMQPTPITPLVLDQDFTDRTGATDDDATDGDATGTRVYKANLIRFRFQIKNNHSSSVVILGVRFTVAEPISGAEKIITVNVSDIISGVSSGIRTLGPNEKLTDAGTGNVPHSGKFIYLDALPAAAEDSITFKYNIKAEVLGYVGTANKPEGRLVSSYTFSTF